VAKDQTAGKARPKSPVSDRLIHAVDGRFERMDTLVGASIVRWIEDSRLDLHEARVLIALSGKAGAMKPAEIAEITGLDLDSAYKAVHKLHGRGLTCEDARRHTLTDRGRDLMRSFAHAREEGVRVYVGSLDAGERRRLEWMLRVTE
jgi:DNA-binding MarR family transcriptional regulator